MLISRACYRAFEIGPKDEEYVSLQNHPSHTMSFDASKPFTDRDRYPPYLSPPEIVRLPLNQNQAAARKKYPKSSVESRTSTKKKTPEVVLDPRAQAVKTMMRQAQQQAQQTHANLVLNNSNSLLMLASPSLVGNAGRVPSMFMTQQSPPNMNQMQMSNNSLARQQQMSQLYYPQMTPQGVRLNNTPQTVLSYLGAPFQFQPQPGMGNSMTPNLPVNTMNTPSNISAGLNKTASSLAIPELPEPEVALTATEKENLVA